MNLAKILKQRRDAERRLELTSPKPVFNGGAADSVEGGGNEIISDGVTLAQLTTGLAGKSDTDHTHEFVDLTDTPSAYTGAVGKIVAVNSAATALEFVAAPAAANGVPAGGTTNQLAAKNSNTDYDLKWVDAPNAANGIPTGGTTGQMLSKIDGTDYNAEWADAPSGSSGGTPVSEVDGCTVWLKADAITDLVDGDAVPIWNNSAKNANNFPSVDAIPIYKTNIINGKPVIRFNGGYYAGRTDAMGLSYTAFVVTKFTSIASYVGLLHFGGIDGSHSRFFVKSNGKSAIYAFNDAGIYDGDGVAVYDTSNWSITTFSKKSNSSVETRRNKSLDRLVLNTGKNIDVRQLIFIGNDPYYASRNFVGDMAEFILYDRELTSTEIASVEGYLNTKYALGL